MYFKNAVKQNLLRANINKTLTRKYRNKILISKILTYKNS